MIISASRRTDIPAYYSEWLLRRLQTGFVQVPNPFNPKQISQVDLSPNQVDIIVFWTKNPAPLIACLDRLEGLGYRDYCFLFTLNGYPRELEPGIPALAERLELFRLLAARVGPERMTWRYDPIVFADSFPPEWHADAFAKLSATLAGTTHRVIVSVVDIYRKTKRHLQQCTDFAFSLDPWAESGLGELWVKLAASAHGAGMQIQACAEAERMAPHIQPGACLDAGWLSQALGRDLTPARHRGQRPACRCVHSADIGMNNTCAAGCLYCYATNNHQQAKVAYVAHNPNGPTLI